MPDPRDYLIPEETSLWGEEYRAAGGLTAQDMLSWQDANRASQYDSYGYEPEPVAPPQQQTYLDPEQFVDWPTYQGIVSGKLKPHEAYDEYLTVALPTQLRDMGYGDDEIRQELQQFSQLVQAPAVDNGFIGNIWDSITGGVKGGTRAEQATGNLIAGDLDDIAKLVTEQATGQRPNAPLQRFQQAISTPEAQAGLWDAVKAYAGAAWDEKEGALNFLAEQFAQSYPSLIGGVGGAGAGALAGPLGALVGGVAGIGAGSASVEVGSQILERVASAAQARGIDPRDTNAVRAMINDPEVYNELRNAALAKGLTVGAADAAVSAFSLGMGKYAAQAARAGSRGRATGFAGAGLAGETVGGAGGEALSQVAAGDQLNYRDIVGEAFGELGPGGANVLIGSLLPQQRQVLPGETPPVEEGPDDFTDADLAASTLPEEPPPPPNPTLMVGSEGVAFLPTPENIAARDTFLRRSAIDIPEAGETIEITDVPGAADILPPRDPDLARDQARLARGVENIDITPPDEPPPPGGMEVGAGPAGFAGPIEEITLQPAQAVDSAELRIRDGRLLTVLPPGRGNPPLLGGVPGVGTPEQLEDLRLAYFATEQPVDLDARMTNEENLLSWMADRGVQLVSDEQRAIVQDLIGTRPNDRQAFIADAVDGLASSPQAGAEPLAQALLAISRSIPKERNTRARAQAALEAVLPGVPLAEIPKVVASEAAQKVMADLEAGVTDAPTAPSATTTPASPLTARRSRGRPAGITNETPFTHVERPLAAGESLPTSGGLGGLVGQLVGPGPAASNAAPVQQPRGGLRAGVNQEGPVAGGRRGSLRGRQGAVAGGDTGSAGAQPNRLAGARGVPELAPPIEVKLSTERVPRMYGAQEEDVANKEALSEQRLLERAKKQTGGLGKKAAREKQRKIDAVVMDKAEYEKTYPGRSHDDDTNDLLDMPKEGAVDNREYLTDAQRAGLSGTTDQALQYLMSVMQSPMARLVAEQIRALGLVLPPIRFDPTLSMAATYRMNRQRDPDGRAIGIGTGIIVNPNAASLEAVLHEFVHAATMKLLTEPETQIQIDARKKLEALRVYVNNTMPGLAGTAEGYGLTNVYEFVSEALSSSAFQARLASLPLPGKAKSVWKVFKELVMRLLGNRTTALSESILAASDLFSGQQIGLAGFSRRLKEDRIERGVVSAADAINLNAPPASNAKANSVPSSAIVGTKNNVRSFVAYAKDKTNPNTTYTLYPVTSQEFRGVKGAGIAGLSRADVEQRIKADGSEVIPPASDTTIKSGVPKNTATKKVGYDSDGNLQSAAFQQKDGTWTYYESDADVRTDPHARVTKGLSTDAVQRFITARGLVDAPPKGGAVKAGSATVTSVGYEPASWKRRMFQDKEGTLINIGGSAEEAALLRNGRVENKLRQVNRQYVEPARKAGQQITQSFNKTEDQIFELMQNLHVVERLQTKMRQLARGNMSQQEQAVIERRMQKDMAAAEAKVNAERASNPAYVKAVEQELAPKLKAMADNTIDMNAAYGFIERGEAENIKRAYDFYVPLQKDDKRTTVGKAATGSSTSGDLSFPRMVEQAMRTVARGEQNVVRNEVLKLAEQNLLKIKDTGEVPVTIGPKHVIRYNKENNSLDTGEDNFVFDRDAIDVYRNGERIRMKITDPSLLDALNPYKGEERPVVVTAAITAVAQINRLISIGKTSMNPAWPPFNFARDVLTSNINLPTGVSRAKYWAELANPLNYASVLWNVAREAIGKEPVGSYADARAANAFISHRAFIGLDPIAHDVQAMFKPPIVSFDKEHLYGLSQKGTLLGKRASDLFQIMSIYPQWAESVPRMAMYKAAKASGLSEEKAGLAAKNASVNFERRGKLPISNYWIFANAKMQGLHALTKTFERQGLLKSGIGVTSIIALGAIAAAFGYEWSEKDKDGKSKYAKVPDFKKDSLLLFKADAAGIPIPQEVVPFYVLGNAAVEAAMGGITWGKAGARWFTSLMNNVWPGSVAQQDPVGHNANLADFITRMLIPSQIAPLYDTGTNRNTFGREVVSGQENKKKLGMPNSEMGSPNENQLAVNAAKGLYQATDGKVDVAPQQIKLWNNFFNPAAEGWGFWSDLLGDRQPKYVGEEVNPFLRKWKGNATEFYDQEQFDELLAKAKRAKYLVDDKNPNRVSIDKLSPEDQVLARSAQMLDKVDRDGDALFKGYKLMTPERRKLLNDRKRDLVLGGIRRYNEMRDQAVPKR